MRVRLSSPLGSDEQIERSKEFGKKWGEGYEYNDFILWLACVFAPFYVIGI
jgi:hypothetical protein